MKLKLSILIAVLMTGATIMANQVDARSDTTARVTPIGGMTVHSGASSIGYSVRYAVPEAMRLSIIADRVGGRGHAMTSSWIETGVGIATGRVSLFPAFVPGAYVLRVEANGQVLDSKHLQVTEGFAVPVAYVTSTRAIDQLSTRHNMTPSYVRRVQGRAHTLAYYIAYVGARARHTAMRVRLYNEAGQVETADASYRLNYRTGFVASTFRSFVAFPDGAYRLVIWEHGRVAKVTLFTVGDLNALTYHRERQASPAYTYRPVHLIGRHSGESIQ